MDVDVGAQAPEFGLESGTGERINLSDYRGRQNLVLYFMREFT